MSRSRLYTIILLACTGGFIWLWIQNSRDLIGQTVDTSTCLFKTITGVPCPSCGTTRSVFELLDGHLISSLQWNPMGIIVLLIMIISPVWILTDVLFKKETFLRCYGLAENYLKSKWIAIPAIGLVIINWVWNICKGL
jgi:hypothetical protein